MIDPKATAIAAGLKTAYQIAAELGVTPQAVYKKIKNHKELMDYREAGKYVFDEKGEQAVKALFHIEPAIEPIIEPAVEPSVLNQLLNQVQNEVEYLRNQLDTERNRNIELVQQLTEITRNAQVLQGLKQQAKQPGFIKRLFF